MKLPKLFRWRDRPKPPPTQVQGRTGDLRYAANMSAEVAPDGKRRTGVVMANRLDSVTIEDLDRVRLFPVIIDALDTKCGPLERADFYFVCARPDAAEAAQATMESAVRRLLGIMFRGSMEFGRQSAEIVWEPTFDVTVTSGQGEGQVERYYPFMWTCWFKSFSPKDTRVLIHPITGRFAGVRQFVGHVGGAWKRDVRVPKAVHLVNRQEFDGNYGIAETKAAIPWVEAAVSITDSMVQFADVLANPYKKVRYPMGSSLVDGNPVDNGDRALEIGEAFESGSTVCIPSEVHTVGGQPTSIPKWDVVFEQPGSATADYVSQLTWLCGMIRLAATVPEMASGGDAPDSGTYNLGEIQIRLFLQNLQRRLDNAEEAINEYVLKWWTVYNFGASCPPCRVKFKPLDLSVALMLLQALLENVKSGEPIVDAEGNLLYVDWGKVASDNGLSLIAKRANRAAQDLAVTVAKRLQELGNGKSGEEENAEISPESVRDPKLSEWDESKHPRDGDGKFASKGAASSWAKTGPNHRQIPADATMSDIEHAIAHETLEHGLIHTKEGKPLTHLRIGDSDSLKMSPGELARWKGNHYTHNHPADEASGEGTTLSAQDLLALAAHEGAGISAVVPIDAGHEVHSFRLAGEEWNHQSTDEEVTAAVHTILRLQLGGAEPDPARVASIVASQKDDPQLRRAAKYVAAYGRAENAARAETTAAVRQWKASGQKPNLQQVMRFLDRSLQSHLASELPKLGVEFTVRRTNG